MAIGDITDPIVDATGCFASVKVLGVAGGGTYTSNYGLGTNNNPYIGAPSIVLTVQSPGFDQDGNPVTRTRTVYGTRTMRKVWSPTGDNLLPDETVSGSDVIIRFSLSEQVFVSCTATISVWAGWYTKVGVPNNTASGLTVTVNSTLAYAKVIGNWAWPGFEKIGPTHTLRAVGFHGFGQDGQQIACAKFISTDTSGHTVTNIVTGTSVDDTFGDAVPVVEYKSTYDATVFTQGNIVTSNFIMYPWIGDSAAVLDTTVGGTAQPHFWYGPITGVCDKDGSYAPVVAVVDPVGGSDTNSVTGADTSYAAAAAHPYLTHTAAQNGLRTYANANLGRNNPGGMTTYLKDGTYTFSGHATAGTTPDCWYTIENAPGNNSVVIANATATKYATLRMKMVGISFDTSTGSVPIIDASGLENAVWLHRCTMNNATGLARQILYRNRLLHVTQSSIVRLQEGLQPPSTTDSRYSIIRGNTFTRIDGNIHAQTVLGNYGNQAVNGGRFVDASTGSLLPNGGQLINNIVFCNVWYMAINQILAAKSSVIGGSITDLSGLAVGQNIFESRISSVTPLVSIHADGTIGTPVNNVLIFNNTVIGQRANLGYNDHSSIRCIQQNWYVQNNIWQDTNIKGDSFAGGLNAAGNLTRSGTQANATATGHGLSAGDYVYVQGATPAAYNGYFQILASPAPTANTFSYTMLSDPGSTSTTSWTMGQQANRIGNWPLYYGVGCHGNLDCKSVLASFVKLFSGLNSNQTTIAGDPPAGISQGWNYPDFESFAAYNGTTPGAGGGNYRLKAASPAIGIGRKHILSHDIAGVARTGIVSPGAYHYASSSSLLLLRRRRMR